MDAQDRAEMLDLYARALNSYPRWAVSQAFDRWEKSATRRPSPGDLNVLASQAMKEITDELSRRKRIEAEREEPETPQRTDDERAEAARIMNRLGFTPKRMDAVRANPMARNMDEAQAVHEANDPHWTETHRATPEAMEQLRKARIKSGMIKENDQ